MHVSVIYWNRSQTTGYWHNKNVKIILYACIYVFFLYAEPPLPANL